MATQFLQSIKDRRTIYAINKTLGNLTQSRIHEIVKETTLHTPTTFNTQTTRALVLFGDEHEKFWDHAKDKYSKIIPAESWGYFENRINGFSAGAGSVLFFVDTEAVEVAATQHAIIADKVPHWASQSVGMQELLVWTALELEGLGASLQHFNPVVDEFVTKEWDIPAKWKLDAQLVFGGKAGEPAEKSFIPVDERVKVAGLE